MAPGNRNNPRNYQSSDSQYSLMEFMREFPDDAACIEWLWRNRYSEDGEHAHCPKCEAERVFRRYGTKQQRQSWTCVHCGHHLHPTAGTIFHKSSTSLHLWFYAMYLMTSTRCGISAKQLERELGVTYKTAWRMAKLIRQELMVQDDEPFGGEVEMDERLTPTPCSSPTIFRRCLRILAVNYSRSGFSVLSFGSLNTTADLSAAIRAW